MIRDHDMAKRLDRLDGEARVVVRDLLQMVLDEQAQQRRDNHMWMTIMYLAGMIWGAAFMKLWLG